MPADAPPPDPTLLDALRDWLAHPQLPPAVGGVMAILAAVGGWAANGRRWGGAGRRIEETLAKRLDAIEARQAEESGAHREIAERVAEIEARTARIEGSLDVVVGMLRSGRT